MKNTVNPVCNDIHGTMKSISLYPNIVTSDQTTFKQPTNQLTWLSHEYRHRQVLAKCRTKVVQKAPTGAFCTTFVLHYSIACLWRCPCHLICWLLLSVVWLSDWSDVTIFGCNDIYFMVPWISLQAEFTVQLFEK